MMILDVEVYTNYFLVVFENDAGKIASFEKTDDEPLNVARVSHIMRKNLTGGFNSSGYDLIMISAALENRDCADLKRISNAIITSNLPPWRVARDLDIRMLSGIDHIDIIDVAPGQASLKVYAGRLGYPKIQDLPIPHDAILTRAQMDEIKGYCINDARVTRTLFEALRPQIKLRSEMSKEYGVDLRSKSDAQIAEAVLRHEIEKITGNSIRPPKVADGTTYQYIDPGNVKFQTPELRDILARLTAHDFGLAGNGSIQMPDWLRDTKIRIGTSDYQMGIGGLHSCESGQSVRAGSSHILCDFDVASYYPSIILQQGITPDALGDDFTSVYRSIVERRLAAKKSGDSVTANTLKIVVNGSFGKLGSKYSTLYAPNLLIQTTITGQLCLLMLIERMEAAGAKIVSANTDGVVVFAEKHLNDAVNDVAFNWMIDTGYVLERSDYRALYSRDVNNYIAVKNNGGAKRKGAFGEPGLSKNPQFTIVTDAVAAHLSGASDYRDVIRKCRDINKLVMLRKVTGGASWRGDDLGRAVRFYYSTDVGADETIDYSKNSNKVPQSDGARPCMDYPDEFPADVDFERYVGMAKLALKGMGYA